MRKQLSDSDRERIGLEAQREESRKTGQPPELLKPCVSAVLQRGVEKGEAISRNEAVYLVATERRRLGVECEATLEEMYAWNDAKIEPPLAAHEVRSSVESAFRTDYTFGCSPRGKLNQWGLCLGKVSCHYYREMTPRGKQARRGDIAYFTLGWPRQLSGPHGTHAHRLYLTLVFLEQNAGLTPGGRLRVSQRHMADWSGFDLKYVKRALERLEEEGLVRFKPGTPRKWERAATQVERVIPIPEPS